MEKKLSNAQKEEVATKIIAGIKLLLSLEDVLDGMSDDEFGEILALAQLRLDSEAGPKQTK